MLGCSRSFSAGVVSSIFPKSIPQFLIQMPIALLCLALAQPPRCGQGSSMLHSNLNIALLANSSVTFLPRGFSGSHLSYLAHFANCLVGRFGVIALLRSPSHLGLNLWALNVSSGRHQTTKTVSPLQIDVFTLVWMRAHEQIKSQPCFDMGCGKQITFFGIQSPPALVSFIDYTQLSNVSWNNAYPTFCVLCESI